MKEKRKTLHFAFGKVKKVAILVAAFILSANCNIAFAQNLGESQQVHGLDDFYGKDPSSDICTSNSHNETSPDKILYLYNVGAKKFLSIGGYWGTHASLNSSPHRLYIKQSGSSYNVESKVGGSGTGTFMAIQNGHVYMDRPAANISFEKGDGYSETNKVYLVKFNSDNSYLTAFPKNEDMFCNKDSKYEKTNTNYKNQLWKIISMTEYNQLFKVSPANMKALVDATYLIKAPGFRVNNNDAKEWKPGGNKKDDLKSKLLFGDEKMYKDYTKVDTKEWSGYDENHQDKFGKYFYCYVKGIRDYNVYQDIKVTRAGWYVLRCNGFSTANSMENIGINKSPLAYLFTTIVKTDGTADHTKTSAATLNVMSQQEANHLAAQMYGAGIGHAFFEGMYENQVQICINKTADGEEITESNPATLRIGFVVRAGNGEASTDEITAVDNFKLYYAGPQRNPELVLDENSTDLRYLTLATDDYTHSVLHLNRKLNDNMWNSLILPVNLTFGQMKRTFGDAVKVAKLENLTNTTVQFVTIEPKDDDEVMVKAFEPYIVYPPIVSVNSPKYTVDKFYTSPTKDDNSQWLGTDYNPSAVEENRLTMTIPANHYVITMVSFDRKAFKNAVDENWVSKTSFSGSNTQNTMTCKGTMAKTYDSKGIIEGRNDLNGAYFMYKGKLIQVPSGVNEHNERYSYGLKAFRCWFELTDKTSASSKPLSLFIDGIKDSTTGIDDIHANADHSSYKRGIEGVFNINGQKVREGNSTEGLPAGLYIVNGKKIVVR